MSIAGRYTEKVSEKFGYLATWYPSIRLELGTIGTLHKERLFISQGTTIADLGVAFSTAVSPAHADFGSYLDSGSECHFKVAGQSDVLTPHLPLASAGVGMRFHQEGSLFFQLGRSTYESVRDQVALARDLLRLANDGRWQSNWLVVTELVRAQTASILISADATGAAELTVDAGVSPLGVNALKVDGSVSLAYSQSLATQLVAAGDLTPLFRAVRIRKHWFDGRYRIAPAFSADAEDLVTGRDTDTSEVLREFRSYRELEEDEQSQ